MLWYEYYSRGVQNFNSITKYIIVSELFFCNCECSTVEWIVADLTANRAEVEWWPQWSRTTARNRFERECREPHTHRSRVSISSLEISIYELPKSGLGTNSSPTGILVSPGDQLGSAWVSGIVCLRVHPRSTFARSCGAQSARDSARCLSSRLDKQTHVGDASREIKNNSFNRGDSMNKKYTNS